MKEPSAEFVAKARQLILAELARRSVPADIEAGECGEEIFIGQGTAIAVHSFALRLIQTDPDTWEEMAHNLVESVLASLSNPSLAELGEEGILAQIRTRLIPPQEGFAYARPFGENLIQVLCLDFPTTAVVMHDGQVGELPIPLDTLFAVGQANTDAEAIHGIQELDEGVYCIEEDNFYIAAKAGNMGGLMESILGYRPPGVVFGLPRRDLVIFAVPEPDQQDAILAIQKVAVIMGGLSTNPDLIPPGELLSELTYFYSPDAGVETIARTAEVDGKPALVVTPSKAFERVYPA